MKCSGHATRRNASRCGRMDRATSRMSPVPSARKARSLAWRRSCSVIESWATFHARRVDPAPSRTTSRAARTVESAPSQSRHRKGLLWERTITWAARSARRRISCTVVKARCSSRLEIGSSMTTTLFAKPRVLVERGEEERQGQGVAIARAESIAKGRFPRCGISSADRHWRVVDKHVVRAGRPAPRVGVRHAVETEARVEPGEVEVDGGLVPGNTVVLCCSSAALA